jgi:hypothetical protein
MCGSYRGWKNDHITVFTERIQSQFPTAQLLMKSTPPTPEMKSNADISIMISKVNPQADAAPHRFKGRTVPGPMAEYYDRHHVSRFFYVRPFNKGPKTGNEFETLWTERNDLLCESALPRTLFFVWFFVVLFKPTFRVYVCVHLADLLNRTRVVQCNTEELSPIQNAIKSMQDKNAELMVIIEEHAKNPGLSINPLTMALNGVIDAAVMGGTNKYHEAFFTPEFMNREPGNAECAAASSSSSSFFFFFQPFDTKNDSWDTGMRRS